MHEPSPFVSIITRYRQIKEEEARSTSVASDFAVEEDQHSEEEEEGDGGDGKDEVDKGDSKEGGVNQNGEVEKNEGGQSETEV